MKRIFKTKKLNKIYQQLWQENIPKIISGEINFDPQINNPTDTRRGVTLLFRPPESVLKNIRAFLSEATIIEPEQYSYPKTDIHLTMLSIISCEPNLKIEDLKIERYKTLLKKELNDFKSFKLKFKGITLASNSIMIQGFEAGEELNKLRNRLRTAFGNTDLYQTINKRYLLQAAHMTVIRFQSPLKNSEAFKEFLKKNQNRQFGTAEVRELELVFNDWYQREKNTSVLERFELK